MREARILALLLLGACAFSLETTPIALVPVDDVERVSVVLFEGGRPTKNKELDHQPDIEAIHGWLQQLNSAWLPTAESRADQRISLFVHPRATTDRGLRFFYFFYVGSDWVAASSDGILIKRFRRISRTERQTLDDILSRLDDRTDDPPNNALQLPRHCSAAFVRGTVLQHDRRLVGIGGAVPRS